MVQKYGKKTKEEYTIDANPASVTAAVRCCNRTEVKLQDRPGKGEGSDPTLISLSCATPIDCPQEKTYEEAEMICTNMQMKICNNYQITTGICCGSGCNFDIKAVWIRGSK